LDKRQESITLVGHLTRSDTVEGRFKGGSLDGIGMSGVIKHGKDSIDSSISNSFQSGLAVVLLELLHLVQHLDSSIVEVGLGSELGICQEVNEGSLLNKLVFIVDSSEFKLLFSMLQVLILSHFDGVSPLV
jgi:hypothetical protein